MMVTKRFRSKMELHLVAHMDMQSGGSGSHAGPARFHDFLFCDGLSRVVAGHEEPAGERNRDSRLL